MAQRATSLGPKHPLFFLVCLVLFSFFSPFCVFSRKNLFCPPKKGHFLLTFQCLPFSLPSFLFHFPFSVSLSLSLSCYIFLSSFLFLFLFCFPFLSLFSLLCSFAFVSLKRIIRTLTWNCFLLQSFLFWGFPVLFCYSNPFPLFFS